jgi:predicted nicotinamide N-methyase
VIVSISGSSSIMLLVVLDRNDERKEKIKVASWEEFYTSYYSHASNREKIKTMEVRVQSDNTWLDIEAYNTLRTTNTTSSTMTTPSEKVLLINLCLRSSEQEQEQEKNSSSSPPLELEWREATNYIDGAMTVAGCTAPLLFTESSDIVGREEGTGNHAWDGGCALVSYLQEPDHYASCIAGKRVLELGSGMGVVGISICAIDISAAVAKEKEKEKENNHASDDKNDENDVPVDADEIEKERQQQQQQKQQSYQYPLHVACSDLAYTLPLLHANIATNKHLLKCSCEAMVVDWFHPPPEAPSPPPPPPEAPPPNTYPFEKKAEEKGKESSSSNSPSSAPASASFDVLLVADCVWLEELIEALFACIHSFAAKREREREGVKVVIAYQR